jgi:hypothetical protein
MLKMAGCLTDLKIQLKEINGASFEGEGEIPRYG